LLSDQKRASDTLNAAQARLVNVELQYLLASGARRKSSSSMPGQATASPQVEASANNLVPSSATAASTPTTVASAGQPSQPAGTMATLTSPFQVGRLAIRVPRGFGLLLNFTRTSGDQIVECRWNRTEFDMFKRLRESLYIGRYSTAELGGGGGGPALIPTAVERAIATLRFAGTPQKSATTEVVANGLAFSRMTLTGALPEGEAVWHVLYVLPGRTASDLTTAIIGTTRPDATEIQSVLEQAIRSLAPVETVTIPEPPGAVPLANETSDDVLSDEIDGGLFTIRPPKGAVKQFGFGDAKQASWGWGPADPSDSKIGRFQVGVQSKPFLPDRASRWHYIQDFEDTSTDKTRGKRKADIVQINDIPFYRLQYENALPGKMDGAMPVQKSIVWFAETDSASISISASVPIAADDEFLKTCESAIVSLKLSPAH
jgi:hypothetical protein